MYAPCSHATTAEDPCDFEHAIERAHTTWKRVTDVREARKGYHGIDTDDHVGPKRNFMPPYRCDGSSFYDINHFEGRPGWCGDTEARRTHKRKKTAGTISHRMLIEKIADDLAGGGDGKEEINDAGVILILEDDATISPRLQEQFDAVVPWLPDDWDLLQAGWFSSDHFPSPQYTPDRREREKINAW